MNPDTPLFKKLALRAGYTIAVLNAPREFDNLLGELPKGASLGQDEKPNCLLLFVTNSTEFHALIPGALARLKHDALCWIAYPKKTGNIKSDLSRDSLWELMKGTGLRPVTQIAIDDTWSALRFRPEEMVKKS